MTESLQGLREAHWVQNISFSPGRVRPVTFEGIGTYDVDEPIFKAVRKGIYFPQLPNLNRVEQNVPTSYEAVLEKARLKGLVIGFSGYATGGHRYDYEAEFQAIKSIFETLVSEHKTVSLAVHGGTREGIPVIANLISSQHNVESMGVLPFQGLDWLAEPSMDYLVVTGANWGDESEVLGQAPDVLFLFGGGNNALKDCEAAIAHGKKLAIIKLKDYPESSATNRIDKQKADVICSNLQELQEYLKGL